MFELSKTKKENIAKAKKLKDVYNKAFLDLYNYLDSLYLNESYLIRYNPSRDFIINWLKNTINSLDDYLCLYENEWLNKVKGRLSYRLLIISILLIAKKAIKINCPDNAADFLKHDVDGMAVTIDYHLSHIYECKDLEKYTKEKIKVLLIGGKYYYLKLVIYQNI